MRPAFVRIARGTLFSDHFVLYLTVVYFLVLWPFIPHLASPQNLANLLSNVWPLLAVAVGQTVVLLIAGIDLSQTSIMATTSVLGAAIMSTRLDPVLFEKSPLWGILLGPEGGPLAGTGAGIVVAIVVMLVAGSAIGAANGALIARFRMPAFMVTLATMMFFSAFAIFLTKSENISALPPAFTEIGRGGLGPTSWSLAIAVGLAALTGGLLGRTVLGRWIYALGQGPRTALVSGVPTRRVIVFAYAFSGLCAAVGAVLYTARLETGLPTLGQNLLLDVIGAVVIGGTSLFGGKGRVLWTVYGVLFFALLSNTLNLLNLSFFTINIVKGGIILLAAVLDVARTKLRTQTVLT